MGEERLIGRFVISVQKLPEFEELLHKAQQQADQLQETLYELAAFSIDIETKIEGEVRT